MAEKTVQRGINFPPDLLEKLEKMAKESHRSLAELICFLLTKVLSEDNK